MIFFKKKLLFYQSASYNIVDGRNPALRVLYEILRNMGYSEYQLVQEFFHQQIFLQESTPINRMGFTI